MKQRHVWAGQAARSAGVAGFFDIGELTRHATNSFWRVLIKPDIKVTIRNDMPQLGVGPNVLLKGSRSMALENVVIGIDAAKAI